jgi:hypothetical protein
MLYTSSEPSDLHFMPGVCSGLNAGFFATVVGSSS